MGSGKGLGATICPLFVLAGKAETKCIESECGFWSETGAATDEGEPLEGCGVAIGPVMLSDTAGSLDSSGTTLDMLHQTIAESKEVSSKQLALLSTVVSIAGMKLGVSPEELTGALATVLEKQADDESLSGLDDAEEDDDEDDDDEEEEEEELVPAGPQMSESLPA